MKILKLRLILLIIALTSFLFVVAAQTAPDFGSLAEVLIWVIEGGGAMILAGFIVAYLLENLAFWHNLPVFVKKITPVVMAALLGVGAQSVLLGDLLSYIPPVIQSMMLMLVAWLFSQIAYKGIKEGGYGESTRVAAASKLPPTPDG